MDLFARYDLYLTKGCDYLPDFGDLDQVLSFVTYPAFQQWIIQPVVLGFLQLDLLKPSAVALLHRLRSAGAMGLVIKAAYRQPKVTFVEAYLLADKALIQRQKQNFAQYTFESVIFYQERPQTWTFISACPQWVEEGYVPGALFADVDKIDGHIWQREEYKQG